MGILIVVIGMVLPLAVVIAGQFRSETIYTKGNYSVVQDCGEYLVFEKGKVNHYTFNNLEDAISTADSLNRSC